VYEEVSSPEPEPVFLNFTINSVDLMEADEYSPVCNFNYCKKMERVGMHTIHILLYYS